MVALPSQFLSQTRDHSDTMVSSWKEMSTQLDTMLLGHWFDKVSLWRTWHRNEDFRPTKEY